MAATVLGGVTRTHGWPWRHASATARRLKKPVRIPPRPLFPAFPEVVIPAGNPALIVLRDASFIMLHRVQIFA